MTKEPQRRRVAFTSGEIRAFKFHAVIVAAIAAAMSVVAPKGIGQTIGALCAVALLPVPPVVVYFLRKRKGGR